MADAGGFNLTPDGFVLKPTPRAWRDAKLAALIPFGGMAVVAGAISPRSVLVGAAALGFGVLIGLIAWYSSTPPTFALSGDLITLRGHAQNYKLSKSELAGIYRGRSSGRYTRPKTYWLFSNRGKGTFSVDVRFFDPDELEKAMSSLGADMAGDFKRANIPERLMLKWMGADVPS